MALAAASALLATGCSSSDDDPKADDPSSSSQSPTESPTESPSESPDSVTGTDGEGDDADGGDDGTIGGRPTLEPSEVPTKVAKETDEATDDFLDRVSDKLEKPDAKQDLKAMPGVTGPALDELRNRITEYDASGWKVVGEPSIVSHRVVQLLDDPERAIVHACIDNSAVRVVDAKGKRVPNSKPAQPRTRNIITLVKKKGAWVVTEQRPANKPNC